MRKIAVVLVLVACGSDAVVATVPDAGADAGQPDASAPIVDSGGRDVIPPGDTGPADAADASHAAPEAGFAESCTGACTNGNCRGNCAALYDTTLAENVNPMCWGDHTVGRVDLLDRCTFFCRPAGGNGEMDPARDFLCNSLDASCGVPSATGGLDICHPR